ncbi:MAG: amidohydrolase family protein [Solirubrobacterales bacterium]
MKIDIHQHHWTVPLLAALGTRTSPPFARADDGDWILTLAGEADTRLTLDDLDIQARAERLAAAGFDAAVLAISSPAGIEDLPVSESRPLIEAHLEGVRRLAAVPGPRLLHWGVGSAWRVDTGEVDAQLSAGAVGWSIPAGAIAAPEGFERQRELLAYLEECDAPLFVHPGPGPFSELAIGSPKLAWWPALTRYVAEMSAAWHAFVAVGRERHPKLRVVFAMLAGLAPLHIARLDSRGGPAGAAFDPLLWYDTSSYDARTIEAVSGIVGPGQIVFGSDAPVIESEDLPRELVERAAGDNAARLFGPRLAALGVAR